MASQPISFALSTALLMPPAVETWTPIFISYPGTTSGFRSLLATELSLAKRERRHQLYVSPALAV